MIVQKDILNQGLDRLPAQFSNKHNFRSILTAYLFSVDKVEQDLNQYLNDNNIDDATGKLLDNIGAIVGAFRLGRSNSSYREAIRLQILINNSEGTPDQLLEVLQLITDAGDVSIYEHFPLSPSFKTNGQNIPEGLAQTLTSASPITSENVVVAHDVNSIGFTPAERDSTLVLLITDIGEEVIDDQGNNIAISIQEAQGESSERAVLKERDAPLDGFSVLLEGYR